MNDLQMIGLTPEQAESLVTLVQQHKGETVHLSTRLSPHVSEMKVRVEFGFPFAYTIAADGDYERERN